MGPSSQEIQSRIGHQLLDQELSHGRGRERSRCPEPYVRILRSGLYIAGTGAALLARTNEERRRSGITLTFSICRGDPLGRPSLFAVMHSVAVTGGRDARTTL